MPPLHFLNPFVVFDLAEVLDFLDLLDFAGLLTVARLGMLLASPEQLADLEQRLLTVLRDFRDHRQTVPDEVSVWIEITAAPSAAVNRGPRSHRST